MPTPPTLRAVALAAMIVLPGCSCGGDDTQAAPSDPVLACDEGRVDANGDAADGCECLPSADGIEHCDGADNDCNGTVDDGVAGTGIGCDTTELGVCADGLTACVGGVFTCSAQQGPSSETCDGLDNDCDGAVDEEGSWISYSDGLKGGNIHQVAYDPRFAGVAYAIVGNLVFRSADRGDTFARAGEAPATLRKLAFPPNAPESMLAASEEGLLRSTDEGASWTTVSLGGVALYSILVHPADATRVYVGTYGAGVLRSTNGGASFAPSNEGFPTWSVVQTLVGDPADPDVVVAGLFALDPQGAYSYNNGEILRTTNGAANWTSPLGPIGWVHRIEQCPTNGNLLYAAVDGYGLARSQDAGASWSYVGMLGQRIHDLSVAPTSCATIYADVYPEGIHRSTDGGQSFVGPLAGGMDVQYPGAVITSVDGMDAQRVLAANHSGVFLSVNSANGWTRVGLIDAPNVRQLAVSSTNPQELWMGTWGQGLWVKPSIAAPWSHIPSSALPRDWIYSLAHHPSDGDDMFVGIWGNDVWRTTDGAASFSSFTGIGNIMAMARHPTLGLIAYAATQVGGVWKTGDGAQSWTATNAGLPPPWPTGPCVCQDIRAVVIDEAATDTIYIGSNGEGVFVSTDAAGSWQATASELAGESIPCLAQPEGTGELYACVAGKGIWRSTDGAASFVQVTQGLADLNNVESLYVDPLTNDLYATSDRGVFRSVDGAIWSGLDNECLPAPTLRTTAIVDDGTQRLLVVGTWGAGVLALRL